MFDFLIRLMEWIVFVFLLRLILILGALSLLVLIVCFNILVFTTLTDNILENTFLISGIILIDAITILATLYIVGGNK